VNNRINNTNAAVTKQTAEALFTLEDVINLVRDGGITSDEWYNLAVGAGMSDATFYRLTQNLFLLSFRLFQ
jgi:hypothetical protein